MGRIWQIFRFRQWLKNFIIFAPLIFSGHFGELYLWWVAVKAMIGFSFMVSACYIINDLIDRKADMLHPTKSKRLIASGQVSISTAIIYIFSSLLLSGVFLVSLPKTVLFAVGGYVFIQVIYNMFSKHLVILDAITIAAGFFVRVWIGALAIGVEPSMWLQLCVFVLALFLGFTKRRHELSLLTTKAASHRPVLAEYSFRFLDQIIMICSTLSVVFYSLYTISPDVIQRIGHSGLLYSVVFVVYGIFRYLYLVYVKKMGDDPGEALLSDGPLLFNILAWLVFVVMLLWKARGG